MEACCRSSPEQVPVSHGTKVGCCFFVQQSESTFRTIQLDVFATLLPKSAVIPGDEVETCSLQMRYIHHAHTRHFCLSPLSNCFTSHLTWNGSFFFLSTRFTSFSLFLISTRLLFYPRRTHLSINCFSCKFTLQFSSHLSLFIFAFFLLKTSPYSSGWPATIFLSTHMLSTPAPICSGKPLLPTYLNCDGTHPDGYLYQHLQQSI